MGSGQLYNAYPGGYIPATTLQRARRRVLPTLALGLFGGSALGVMARLWMRLIAKDPEFTWSGTIFIVIGFTIFGLTQSVVALARQRTSRRWKLTIVRVFGVIGILPLFVAAGGQMAPAVIGGGLALSRTDWRWPARLLCVLVAAVPSLFVGGTIVDSFGWSVHAVAGFGVMLAVYGAISTTTRFTFAAQDDGWRPSRWTKAIIIGLIALTIVVLAVGVGLR